MSPRRTVTAALSSTQSCFRTRLCRCAGSERPAGCVSFVLLRPSVGADAVSCRAKSALDVAPSPTGVDVDAAAQELEPCYHEEHKLPPQRARRCAQREGGASRPRLPCGAGCDLSPLCARLTAWCSDGGGGQRGQSRHPGGRREDRRRGRLQRRVRALQAPGSAPSPLRAAAAPRREFPPLPTLRRRAAGSSCGCRTARRSSSRRLSTASSPAAPCRGPSPSRGAPWTGRRGPSSSGG